MGIVVFVRILYAGFLWLTAAGNASKAGDARNKIQSAVVGAILLFAAYLILYIINPDLVKNTFDFSVPVSQTPVITTSVQPAAPTAGPAQIVGRPATGTSFLDKLINTVKAEGVYVFDLSVVDDNGDGCTKTYTMEVLTNSSSFLDGHIKMSLNKSSFMHRLFGIANAATDCSIVSFSTDSVPNGVEGVLYYAEIPAVGGQAPYVYSITNGSLPPGLGLTTDWSGNAVLTVTGTPDPSSSVDNRSIGYFRTVKLVITKPGPISIREVEIYNTSGVKLEIGKIRESGIEIHGSGSTSEASKAVDGNPDTAWIATGSSSLSGLNTAWILFDLDVGQGSAQRVSRVKVMPGNDSATGNIQVMVTAAGADDPTGGPNEYTYQPIGSYMPYSDAFLVRGITTPVNTWRAPFQDRQFLQYPPLSYDADPTVSFTVNGQESVDVNKSAGVNGEPIIYSWTTANADFVTVSGYSTRDPASTINLSPDDQRICNALNNYVIIDTFNSRGSDIPVNGSAEGAQYYSGCVGYILTTTITAGQRYSGETITDTVITRLK